MRPKSNGSLPSVCITAKGRICYKIRLFFVCGGLRPSGPPRKQLFLHLPQRGGPVHPVDPAPQKDAPTPSPLGEAWGSVYFAGAHIMRPTPCTEKSRPAAGRASIAISYFRHRFKVGSQARRSLSASSWGPKGCPFSSLNFRSKAIMSSTVASGAVNAPL